MRVLVLESGEDWRRLIEIWLQNQIYDLVFVSDFTQALDLIESGESFDVLLTDSSGLSLLPKAKSLGVHSVMLSIDSHLSDVALASGATVFLDKLKTSGCELQASLL